MGIAAYNRGTKILRWRIDVEREERIRQQIRQKIYIHEYEDCRNGNTVLVAYDDIGPIANQRAALAKASHDNSAALEVFNQA